MHEKVHCRIKREKHWRKQMIRILILSSEFPNSLQQNAYFAFNRKWSTSVKFLTRISSWGKNGERRTQNKNSDKCTLSWHEPFQIYTHYLLLPLRFYINQIFTKVKKKKKSFPLIVLSWSSVSDIYISKELRTDFTSLTQYYLTHFYIILGFFHLCVHVCVSMLGFKIILPDALKIAIK